MISPQEYRELIDAAAGAFSFVSAGVRLTHDLRAGRLLLAREWRP